MQVLKRIESALFIEQNGIKIFLVKSKSELKGLSNKFPLRMLFDGSTLYAWKAEEMDHRKAKEVLKNYDENINNFEGLLLEQGYLVPSLQKRAGIVDKFIKKYFPNSKVERCPEGIKL